MPILVAAVRRAVGWQALFENHANSPIWEPTDTEERQDVKLRVRQRLRTIAGSDQLPEVLIPAIRRRILEKWPIKIRALTFPRFPPQTTCNAARLFTCRQDVTFSFTFAVLVAQLQNAIGDGVVAKDRLA